MPVNTDPIKQNRPDLNTGNITGTLTSATNTASVPIGGKFTLSISGFGTASVNLERSFDGTNWKVVDTFTGNTEKNGEEWATGLDANGNRTKVLYRLNCTSYTSGTIAYYLGG